MLSDKSVSSRILALFALLALAAGSGSRAQEASPLKARYTKHEYQIAMRDGVKLLTSVYVPKDASQKYPNCVERRNGKDRGRRRRVEVPVARISQAVEIERVKEGPGSDRTRMTRVRRIFADILYCFIRANPQRSVSSAFYSHFAIRNPMRTGTFIFTCVVLIAFAATFSAQTRPNIIFIHADDLGYGDLSCYGQLKFKTPNIDRLATEGIRFTQYYAGSTVCAPSRSALMTGQHTGTRAFRGNARHPLLPEDVTVAEVLKSAQYKTALIGKWGLGEAGTTGVPNRQGFDYFFGYLNQRHAHNYYPTFLWRNEERSQIAQRRAR